MGEEPHDYVRGLGLGGEGAGAMVARERERREPICPCRERRQGERVPFAVAFPLGSTLQWTLSA
jgi:hypothetical protein